MKVGCIICAGFSKAAKADILISDLYDQHVREKNISKRSEASVFDIHRFLTIHGPIGTPPSQPGDGRPEIDLLVKTVDTGNHRFIIGGKETGGTEEAHQGKDRGATWSAEVGSPRDQPCGSSIDCGLQPGHRAVNPNDSTDYVYHAGSLPKKGSGHGDNDNVGEEPYKFFRVPLNVEEEYGSTTWIGTGGPELADGEWPIAYHGVNKARSGGTIAQEGYEATKSSEIPYGRGIYTTPSVAQAARFATKFEVHGKQYEFFFQNRVNPESLIKVPADGCGDEFWISPSDEDVRPYTICLNKL